MNNLIITVNRECGTGGRTIARKMGEILGMKVYDRHVLDAIAGQFGMSVESIEQVKAKKQSWWDDICRFYQKFGAAASIDTVEPQATPLSVFNAERKLLLDIAEKEPCVIVGRAGFHIFRDHPNAVHMLFIADLASRVKRISRIQNIAEEEARKMIDRIDKERETFTRTVAETSRYEARHYDLVLNVTGHDPDEIAKSLSLRLKLRINEPKVLLEPT